jgi:hypothetical protein
MIQLRGKAKPTLIEPLVPEARGSGAPRNAPKAPKAEQKKEGVKGSGLGVLRVIKNESQMAKGSEGSL